MTIQKDLNKSEFETICSIIKKWADNNYNINILPKGITGKLLEELIHAGEPIVKHILEAKIKILLF